MIGYDLDDLEGESFYSMVHPEDLGVFSTCHKACELVHLFLIICIIHFGSPVVFWWFTTT